MLKEAAKSKYLKFCGCWFGLGAYKGWTVNTERTYGKVPEFVEGKPRLMIEKAGDALCVGFGYAYFWPMPFFQYLGRLEVESRGLDRNDHLLCYQLWMRAGRYDLLPCKKRIE